MLFAPVPTTTLSATALLILVVTAAMRSALAVCVHENPLRVKSGETAAAPVDGR